MATIVITVLLTFDRKDKKSWFDKISTVIVTADEAEIRSLALGMSEEGKKKLFHDLQANLIPIDTPESQKK